MKKILVIFTALLSPISFAGGETPPNPFTPVAGQKAGTGIDARVSNMDLQMHHNANDAINQIIAGLPPEARSSFVVDIPEEALMQMPIKGELRVRDVPLLVLMRYLEKLWPVGYKLQNNEIHICKERADDIITVIYRLSKRNLEEIGIVPGPSQTFRTKTGRMWPAQSEWDAAFTQSDVDKTGILQLRAARSYQEEFGALLLLKERGYEALSVEH